MFFLNLCIQDENGVKKKLALTCEAAFRGYPHKVQAQSPAAALAPVIGLSSMIPLEKGMCVQR